MPKDWNFGKAAPFVAHDFCRRLGRRRHRRRHQHRRYHNNVTSNRTVFISLECEEYQRNEKRKHWGLTVSLSLSLTHTHSISLSLSILSSRKFKLWEFQNFLPGGDLSAKKIFSHQHENLEIKLSDTKNFLNSSIWGISINFCQVSVIFNARFDWNYQPCRKSIRF